MLVAHNTAINDVPHDVQVFYPEVSPNISRMWNWGLDACKDIDHVAVLNDDVIVPVGWFDRVSAAMTAAGAAIGYMSPTVTRNRLMRKPGPLGERMTGYAWILDTDFGLRVNEDLVWWFSDDDIEWRARLAGGVVAVPGQVEHLHPNASTVGALREQADRDRTLFQQIWGMLP